MAASAGANTFTGLMPVIYEAMDVIPRELVYGVGAVQRDSQAAVAGLNQNIRSPIVPGAALVDIVPGVTNTNGSATTITYADLQITKSRAYPIIWTGEEQMQLGGSYAPILRNQFAQAFRTLANEMEADVVNGLVAGASRAVGTAGTTPFGTSTNMSDFASVVQVMDDNGASQAERTLLLGTTAAASIRGYQTILLKGNEAGSTNLLRGGQLGSVMNLDIGTSAAVSSVGATVGTGSGYVLNGSHTLGATTITAKTGSGTILAGDIVTIGGFKYVVASGLSAPGTFTINGPGLRAAGSDGNTISVVAASVKNVFFQKAGFLLATRLPAMPQGGDAASDVTIVTDPVSGLSFQLTLYKQYRQMKIEVAAAWGVKALRSDYIGLLLG